MSRKGVQPRAADALGEEDEERGMEWSKAEKRSWMWDSKRSRSAICSRMNCGRRRERECSHFAPLEAN